MVEEKLIIVDHAKKLLENLGVDFTVIKNPDYIHPEFEICPMAEKVYRVKGHIPAFVMDMDGTTTTTEVLCIHSLEYMVRCLSGRMSKESWAGLDEVNDYPHIIGNSTTKHVEYLIKKYEPTFKKENILRTFIKSALWTLIFGKDEKRKEEVRNNVINLKLTALLYDPEFLLLSSMKSGVEITERIVDSFVSNYHAHFEAENFNSLVRVGIDVYYQRYHQILEKIKGGDGLKVSAEIFGQSNKNLIEPMPGVLVFLSLIKGWLDEDDVDCLIPIILEDYRKKTKTAYSETNSDIIRENLKNLINIYRNYPAKTALVTSSIFYEADIVMKELMKILIRQIEESGLSFSRKEYLKDKFANYNNLYNAFITASDSSEIRLKPHRDLYSIALHKLHIAKKDFSLVAGFEDSESGTIAIRTAGIGLCVALPFAQTKEHNLKAASHICKGGLPEVILKHTLFINY